MVQAQQARDVKILDLVRAMENTYSFVVSADELNSHPVLQDIMEEILKQTIECGYFIQNYTRRNFWKYVVCSLNHDSSVIEGRPASVIVHPFTDVDDQIAKFCTTFADLWKNFDSRLLVTTALFSSRTASSVDMIGTCPYTFRHFTLSHDLHLACRQVLKPEDMDEYNRTPCLENTRHNVINDVKKWIADDLNEGKKVLWIYGMAGTGKSTLSTTISQIMRGLHRLGAFFFFNRDIPQRNFATLIRTLACRLAMFDARFGDTISRVVTINDNMAGMPLQFQFEKLLSANALKSVEWSRGPIILIMPAASDQLPAPTRTQSRLG